MVVATRSYNKNRGPLSPEQQTLAGMYMSLAKNLAKQHARRSGLDVDELEGAACLGLVEAAQCFDPDKGIQFHTYARYRVEGAVICAVREALAERTRTVKPPEFADWFNVGLSRREDKDLDLVDSKDSVEGWLKRLPPQHAATCRQIYIEGLSQVQVAMWFACSTSRVSAIHKESMAMLSESWRERERMATEFLTVDE